ncbi:diguanylate cyclase with GAF sensor [Frankineae bacterium MT45]|nr:diguanylate cyclase with GAF sensor [Frankineae bacterium MT45]
MTVLAQTDPDDSAGPALPAAKETARLSALHRLDALDQPRSRELNALARLAAYVCGTPTAAVNLIDADRQWSAAAYGYDPSDVARSDSMCATSILTLDVSYTKDATRDARWSTNPHVTGEFDRIRLYAAAPLILTGGEVAGTICAFSDEEHELSRVQLERLRDIAEHVALLLELRNETKRLGHAATRDIMTGLPNRVLFEESLRLAMAKHQRGEAAPAVIFLDLDGFKSINDTYGHAVGDELLRAFCDRTLEMLRASDLLARLAGDELVILCGEPTGEEGTGVDGLVSRLREAFKVPYDLSCGPLKIGASIGVAIAEVGSDAPEFLVARADNAMYLDKRSRKERAAADAQE